MQSVLGFRVQSDGKWNEGTGAGLGGMKTVQVRDDEVLN